MKDVGYVIGGKKQAEELVIAADMVYVHTDIQKLDEVDDKGNPVDLYKYHEVQYEKDEYIKLIAEQNKEVNNLMNTVLGVDE